MLTWCLLLSLAVEYAVPLALVTKPQIPFGESPLPPCGQAGGQVIKVSGDVWPEAGESMFLCQAAGMGNPVGVYSPNNCILSSLHQPLTFYRLAPQLSLICAPVLGPTPRLPHKSPYCLSSGPFDNSEGFSLYVCMTLQCSGKLPPVFICHGETGIAEVMMVTWLISMLFILPRST